MKTISKTEKRPLLINRAARQLAESAIAAAPIAASPIDETYVRNLLGTNLKRFRTRRAMSQIHLADGVGVSKNAISEIEAGKKFISAKTLAKLAAVLNVELFQFYLPENSTVNGTAPCRVYFDISDRIQGREAGL